MPTGYFCGYAPGATSPSCVYGELCSLQTTGYTSLTGPYTTSQHCNGVCGAGSCSYGSGRRLAGITVEYGQYKNTGSGVVLVGTYCLDNPTDCCSTGIAAGSGNTSCTGPRLKGIRVKYGVFNPTPNGVSLGATSCLDDPEDCCQPVGECISCPGGKLPGTLYVTLAGFPRDCGVDSSGNVTGFSFLLPSETLVCAIDTSVLEKSWPIVWDATTGTWAGEFVPVNPPTEYWSHDSAFIGGVIVHSNWQDLGPIATSLKINFSCVGGAGVLNVLWSTVVPRNVSGGFQWEAGLSYQGSVSSSDPNFQCNPIFINYDSIADNPAGTFGIPPGSISAVITA